MSNKNMSYNGKHRRRSNQRSDHFKKPTWNSHRCSNTINYWRANLKISKRNVQNQRQHSSVKSQPWKIRWKNFKNQKMMAQTCGRCIARLEKTLSGHNGAWIFLKAWDVIRKPLVGLVNSGWWRIFKESGIFQNEDFDINIIEIRQVHQKCQVHHCARDWKFTLCSCYFAIIGKLRWKPTILI